MLLAVSNLHFSSNISLDQNKCAMIYAGVNGCLVIIVFLFLHGCTKQCSILNFFGSTASKSLVSNSVTPSDQWEEDFILGVADLVDGPSTLSGSIDVESASGDPSFINLDST